MLSTKGNISTRVSKFLGGRTADCTRCDILIDRFNGRSSGSLLEAVSSASLVLGANRRVLLPASGSRCKSRLSFISLISLANKEAIPYQTWVHKA